MLNPRRYLASPPAPGEYARRGVRVNAEIALRPACPAAGWFSLGGFALGRLLIGFDRLSPLLRLPSGPLTAVHRSQPLHASSKCLQLLPESKDLRIAGFGFRAAVLFALAAAPARCAAARGTGTTVAEVDTVRADSVRYDTQLVV